MKRGDVYWADLGPPAGRRPVVIITRSAAVPVLRAVTVVPITTTVRGIASEVRLGAREGVSDESVASCDGVVTIDSRHFDSTPVGSLGMERIRELDRSLRFALEIVH